MIQMFRYNAKNSNLWRKQKSINLTSSSKFGSNETIEKEKKFAKNHKSLQQNNIQIQLYDTDDEEEHMPFVEEPITEKQSVKSKKEEMVWTVMDNDSSNTDNSDDKTRRKRKSEKNINIDTKTNTPRKRDPNTKTTEAETETKRQKSARVGERESRNASGLYIV